MSAAALPKPSGLIAALLLGLAALGSAPLLAHQHEHQHTPLSAQPLHHHESLYHLAAGWTDQRGQELQLGDLTGSPVIISMIYGNCRTACPMLVNDARQILKRLDDEQQAQIKVVFVSFDSERDSPEALADYAETMAVDTDNWYFLHGNAADVRTLASLLGIRYRQNADGSFDHSNLLALLDWEGRIAVRLEGLQQPPEPLLKKLAQMQPSLQQ